MPRKSPLETSLIELLDRIASHADVSMATLKLAIKEQSFEKNSARRRIGKALAYFQFDPKDMRKRLEAHETKHGRTPTPDDV